MTPKPLLLFALVIIPFSWAIGQVPTITQVDQNTRSSGQKVTLSGSNFGTSAANIVVWFGAQRGTVTNITDQTIEVNAPSGATYDRISVTNTSVGATGWSAGQFMLSFGGTSPFALTNLSTQTDLDAETGLYDLCLCDLDGDGKSDVAGSNSGATSAPIFGVSLYRNTSTAGSFTFAAKTSALASTRTLNIRCGDLNGDGTKELVLTEADPGNRVFILRNTSTAGTISFASQSISLVGKSPKRVEIADLDRDGRPELIVTDQNTENKDLLILPNTSSGATISFGAAITLSVPVTTNTGTDGLAIQDLDGDQLPEIITSQVLSSSGNVYVYKNDSRTGNFIFTTVVKADIAPTTPNNTGAPVNVRVGDIDGDGKADIAVTQFLGSRVSVLRNQSSGSTIQFSAPTSFVTDPYPFGLDLGDIDGDGKADLVVASLTGPITDTNPKSLTILNNTSTPGTVSFSTKLVQPTTYVNRHVVVGDIDGDAKPDLAFASVDDNTRGVPASKLSFLRNKSCITPAVTPGGPLVICSSFPLALQATLSAGASYVWKKDDVVIGAATSASFTPTATGMHKVEITSDGCTKTSNVVDVTIATGSAAAPTFTNNSPLCEGGTLNLSASSAGGTDYTWTGPGGFSATGANISRSPYQPSFAGRYEVSVKVGGCIAAQGSTLVETISLPAFNVNFTGSDVICAGDTKLLQASPNDANFSYQWYDGGGQIASATSASLTINTTGSFYFKAKSTLYPACPEVQATASSFLVAANPTLVFQSPAETCKDTPVTFTNQSVLDANAGAHYTWDFGDAATSTDTSPVHAYTTAATYTVKLTASYRGNACEKTLSKPIKITIAPTASITTTGGIFKLCPGVNLPLAVTPDFAGYLWSNNATTPTINVTAGGNYSVKLTTAAGCQITVNQTVSEFAIPNLTATATPNVINLGEESQLDVTDGFLDYSWAPIETLDLPATRTPKAKPSVTTTYEVQAKNTDGCVGKATVEVAVNVDNTANILKPANFFSPNGDAVNPTWQVGNIQSFPQCAVTIFDAKGVKVFEAKPYLNDWDGTMKGKQLPDGVYYYFIRCDGDGSSKTGSITILK